MSRRYGTVQTGTATQKRHALAFDDNRRYCVDNCRHIPFLEAA